MDKITELLTNKITELKLPLKVMEVKELDEIYQAILVGGNNGVHNWPQYLTDLAKLMESIDCWLITLENDVPDDIHYATIGIRK